MICDMPGRFYKVRGWLDRRANLVEAASGSGDRPRVQHTLSLDVPTDGMTITMSADMQPDPEDVPTEPVTQHEADENQRSVQTDSRLTLAQIKQQYGDEVVDLLQAQKALAEELDFAKEGPRHKEDMADLQGRTPMSLAEKVSGTGCELFGCGLNASIQGTDVDEYDDTEASDVCENDYDEDEADRILGWEVCLEVRHLREDTSASTTPPPRVGKLRDDAPSPHPLEAALLRDEQPPVNQHQILEDYLKQVLASAGLVSQEHFPEVVSMIKNMDQLFRDMRVKMQHSKEVWHRNSRRVSPGDILARILQQEDRRRVHAGLQVLASPPALSSPATPAELNEDAFIRSWVTEILAERILAACESMLYRELKSRNG
ncbi:hypothetical protein AK812_SmicGene32228 [Symbiodinium microadriaticum]|uniref:Uncharacterized protein n=1 Tax=Symbiodinium microadriaticum TaxID=2951 RepID=A0A1Q9CUP0_SYMMI|nr:hypothetical protein AK812_SmicGene32228 [Symbiodinium microadriaticum]